jgi:hypothetical protein
MGVGNECEPEILRVQQKEKQRKKQCNKNSFHFEQMVQF